MAESDDMIVPLLRQMRLENLARHERTRALIGILEKPIGTLEATQRSFEQSMTADTLTGKLVTGKFEERIEVLEQKMRELETLK